MTKRKILVTSALPYANGAIHLGHMLEQIQTDIWVRFQKMRGHECYYVCADDTHGAPIMLAAEKRGISPEQLVDEVRALHVADSQGFLIGHDNYYSTNSPENKELAEQVYKALRADDKIAVRTIEQLYDPEKQMFLPDRFVKGECPKCSAKDQYGDNCEVCGATYNPTELKNPYSAVSGAKPVLKTSEHYFFRLGECADFLKQWTSGASKRADGVEQPHLQQESLNKMNEWIDGGLQDWDISRDAPYFGFEIPDAPGKYFYVWLDAPIGYMASFKNLCDRSGLKFDEWFAKDSQAEMYHFIGKDILYFHALFWPAMLNYSGLRAPTGVFAHGFLTVDGQKMSKSRGTFIQAKSYLDCGLNPEWMRYYIAAKLNGRIEDIDLNLNDFVARVNSDLVGKFVNIASRSAGFIAKRFDGQLAASVSDLDILAKLQAAAEDLAAAFEAREYAKALRDVMALADMVNVYVDANKPWELAKQEGQDARLQEVCTVLINAFRLLTIYLKPVLPKLAEGVEAFLEVAPLAWSDAQTLLLGKKINAYQHLMQRIDPALIDKLIEANKENMQATQDTPAAAAHEPLAETIKIDDFAKVDLRVGKVLECGFVEGSDKLLQFKVDLGFETRNIFSGIRKAYQEPEKLVGRHVIVVANLAERKMRFGVSQGMIVCASGTDDSEGLYLLDVDAGVKPGMRIG
ncbi:methionine--tRNA ligase [Chromobacterium subtsugae]|uniref:Methionine--tRNA ligase n=2 Tax=Chromobacteriaceae TaxID=1499392 RepID=A0ABS7FB15_9NEIS|nr:MULTISPECIES: methionine--tRNA ligase [Chromobacterium]KUM02616.1 methionine--tRNA ligase [Chromobacterium subtsugae]KZE88002.1 methionine--tRNA ligase [Chromobacterium sp. F49]MBW7565505.1 methionine--tRNA ligase [Chromobacterium subtsugae]MBW8286645.1 methionine--tRNA ligase [Chromobacterium subtsugae]WSE90872.1 methionine--tRNA ligase [Chromobacterium subtsugae]